MDVKTIFTVISAMAGRNMNTIHSIIKFIHAQIQIIAKKEMYAHFIIDQIARGTYNFLFIIIRSH